MCLFVWRLPQKRFTELLETEIGIESLSGIWNFLIKLDSAPGLFGLCLSSPRSTSTYHQTFCYKDCGTHACSRGTILTEPIPLTHSMGFITKMEVISDRYLDNKAKVDEDPVFLSREFPLLMIKQLNGKFQKYVT